MSVDTEKSVLKQGAVQHLYGRLSGELLPNCNDSHLLVSSIMQNGLQLCDTLLIRSAINMFLMA